MSSQALHRLATAFVAVSAFLLTGCDQLGIESATATSAKREAEGKAVGGGCRHAARSIEQCYETNKRADKAAVFAGWREMEDYMRDNKIAAVPASVAPDETKIAAGDGRDDEPAEPAREKPAAKAPAARKGS